MLAFAFPVHAKSPEPEAAFTVSGKLGRAVQKYTGLTWLSQHTLELCSSLTARCYLGGHPRFSIKTYSLTDSLSGKFKSIEIDLKGCSYKKIPLGNIHLSTVNPVQFRLFKSKRGRAGVAIPVMVAVKGELSEEQIAKALRSSAVCSSLNFLRIELPGLGEQRLQVLEPVVSLRESAIHINTWLVAAGADKSTGIPLDVEAQPVLQADRYIVLTNTQVKSVDIVEPEKFSLFIEDLLNPLVDFGRFDRKNCAFRLEQFKISGKKIEFVAKLLLVPKEPIQPENTSKK